MRKEKTLLLEEIKEHIDNKEAFLLTKYSALSANSATELRATLRAAGGRLGMVKKTLLIRAAEELGIAIDTASMQGHIAVVSTVEDPVTVTKAVVKFGKDTGTLEVIGGKISGVLYSGADLQKIASLPAKETLQAEIVGLLEAPMRNIVELMEGLLRSIPCCIENKLSQQS